MTKKVFEDDAPHLLLQTTRQKTKLIPNTLINQITTDQVMLKFLKYSVKRFSWSFVN